MTDVLGIVATIASWAAVWLTDGTRMRGPVIGISAALLWVVYALGIGDWWIAIVNVGFLSAWWWQWWKLHIRAGNQRLLDIGSTPFTIVDQETEETINQARG